MKLAHGLPKKLEQMFERTWIMRERKTILRNSKSRKMWRAMSAQILKEDKTFYFSQFYSLQGPGPLEVKGYVSRQFMLVRVADND